VSDVEVNAMMLTLSAARQGTAGGPAVEEEASCWDGGWPPPSADESAGGLTVVQVREGEGRFLLTAALADKETAGASVDLTRDALGLRVGRIVRWVAVPRDALVDEAVVHVSEGLLSVSIPLRVGRKVRHVLHVW
jgi:hypothetical protein